MSKQNVYWDYLTVSLVMQEKDNPDIFRKEVEFWAATGWELVHVERFPYEKVLVFRRPKEDA